MRRAAGTASLLAAAGLAVMPSPRATAPGGAADEPAQLWFSAAAPRAGHVFVGIVATISADAGYRKARFDCGGLIGRTRIPTTVKRFPEGAAVTIVTVCAWSIPRKTAGRRFTAGYSSTVTEASGAVTHADGIPLTWRIVR